MWFSVDFTVSVMECYMWWWYREYNGNGDMVSAHPFLKGEEENFGKKYEGGNWQKSAFKGGTEKKGGLEL